MSVFLTGATGFLGRHLLPRLDLSRHGAVRCLVRDPARGAALATREGVEIVPGTLHDVDSWGAALVPGDTVVHLAALTGKATLAEHRYVNTEGTRRLLAACRDRGVRRFVHVSTIAVEFPENRSYPYARTKQEAEEMVRASGLDWAIVRPTIVLGPGSPLWDKFRSLAAAPVLIVFGDGRVRINPVHVEDVATGILALVESERLEGRVVGLGGRDVLTMQDFLTRMRRSIRGTEGPVAHVPVRPIVGTLSVLEKFLMPVLPVGSGQFYSFLYDSVPAASDTVGPPAIERRGVSDMIRELTAGEPEGTRASRRRQTRGEAASAPGATRAPTVAEQEVLEAECRIFHEYLIGREPSAYVLEKYLAAHATAIGSPVTERAPVDALVRFARRGPLFVRLADVWGAVFQREGALRRKLVLLVAILESHGDTSTRVDSPDSGSAAGFFVRTGLAAVEFALTFVAAGLLYLPWCLLGGGRSEGEGK